MIIYGLLQRNGQMVVLNILTSNMKGVVDKIIRNLLSSFLLLNRDRLEKNPILYFALLNQLTK